MPADVPERPERAGQSQAPLGVAHLDVPAQRRPQVVALPIESVQAERRQVRTEGPLLVGGAGLRRRRRGAGMPLRVRLHQGQVVGGVAFPRGRLFPTARELLRRVLAHRLQQEAPGLTAPNLFHAEQVVALERRDALQHVEVASVGRGAHRLDRREVAAPGKHRQAAEQRLLRRREQVVTPGEGRAQRALPRRQIERPTGQELQPSLQARQQRVRRRDPDAGGGQLQRERQSVHPPADRRHRRGVPFGENEIRLDRRRRLHEQGDGGVRRERVQRRQALRVRRHQGGDGDHAFGPQAQRRSAGHDYGQPGTGGDEIGQQRRGRGHLLEVVQQQEHLAITQGGGKAGRQRPRSSFRDAERLGDGGGDQLGVAQRGQRDPDRAVTKGGQRLLGHAHRQARLAHAAGAGQRDHTDFHPAEQGSHGRGLRLPSDQGRGRRWQTGADRCGVGFGRYRQRPCRRRQGSDITRRQEQRLSQATQRVRVGPAQVPFEVAHTPLAQPGPLGQRSLAEPGRLPKAAE